MSYEGHIQNICKNGHLFECDSYIPKTTCPVCLASIAWSNEVDDTNGEEYGHVDLDPFRRKAGSRVTEQTSKGWRTIEYHAEYNIPPKDVEKTFRDEDGHVLSIKNYPE
jgi:hypothetical protein